MLRKKTVKAPIISAPPHVSFEGFDEQAEGEETAPLADEDAQEGSSQYPVAVEYLRSSQDVLFSHRLILSPPIAPMLITPQNNQQGKLFHENQS